MTVQTDIETRSESAGQPAGAASRRAVPERRCIVTRASAPKEGMIRFVRSPDGVLTPDLAEVLPGRGLWLTARRDIVETAVAKRQFGRALKAAVDVPANLADRIEALLVVRCVDLLGLLNRAGQLSVGAMRAREWVRAGKAALLLTAADSDGRDGADLKQAARDIDVADVLRSEELGRAIGRERIVHMAVAGGRLGDALLRETRRLAGFRDRS